MGLLPSMNTTLMCVLVHVPLATENYNPTYQLL